MTLITVCNKEEMERIEKDPEAEKQYIHAMAKIMYGPKGTMDEYLKEELDKYKDMPLINMSERK